MNRGIQLLRMAAGARREEPSAGPVAGMALWLDAADASTLFTTDTGSTQSGDTDPVGRWEDKSGNGFHAIQPSSGARPTLTTNVINGKPVTRYSNGPWLDLDRETVGNTGLFAGPGEAFTVFAVSRVDTGQGVILARAIGSGALRTFNLYSSNSTPGATPGIGLRGVNSITNFAHNDGNAHIHTIRWDGSNAAAYGDGVFFSLTVGSADENTGDRIIIGARSNGGGFHLTGDIAEILIYDTALSTANRQENETYLAAKWGITLS